MNQPDMMPTAVVFQAGHLPVIKLLLMFGADPTIIAASKSAQDLATLLAEQTGNADAAMYLARTAAWSPIHIAVGAGLLDEAREALHLGLLDVHPCSRWLCLFLPSPSPFRLCLRSLAKSNHRVRSMGRGWMQFWSAATAALGPAGHPDRVAATRFVQDALGCWTPGRSSFDSVLILPIFSHRFSSTPGARGTSLPGVHGHVDWRLHPDVMPDPRFPFLVCLHNQASATSPRLPGRGARRIDRGIEAQAPQQRWTRYRRCWGWATRPVLTAASVAQ